MRIERCYFCSNKVYPGHGIQFVRNDSKVFKFCRSRCHRHFKRKKNPRKVRWTKAFRKTAGKELTIDPSFEFEKQRNVPTKYNRELWQKTLDAMKQVTKIREKREHKFVMDRLMKGVENDRLKDLATVKHHMHVIRSPAAGLRQKKTVEDEMEMEEEVEERLEAGPSKTVEDKPDKIADEELMSEDEDKIEEDDSGDDGDDSSDDDDE